MLVAAKPCVSEISCLEMCRQHNEWDVDGGQVMGQPAWQVDVRDRARPGPEALSHRGERASKSVGARRALALASWISVPE